MNILILTGRFGMGHDSVAKALYEEIHMMYDNVNIQIIDIIDYMFKNMNKPIYKTFNLMASNYSSLYNLYTNFTDKKTSIPMKKFVTRKMSNLIETKSTNLILSTLPLASQLVSIYKENSKKDISLYTYITDIELHGEWVAQNTNLYFVGAEETKNKLISKGVDSQKIIVSGIPVKKAFKQEELKISKINKTINMLIMGGGLGILPNSDDLLCKLCSNDNINITIITGKNNKLRESIKSKYHQIEVIGYTDNVHYYMKKSDILITKSGGITTFEAINSEIPLFIIKPFLRQEVGNAKFIEKENLGRVAWVGNMDLVEDIISFANNRKVIESIKENMKKLRQDWSQCCPLTMYYMEGDVGCQ